MYAQVALTLPALHRVLVVPATALLNDAGGLHLATVDAGGRIRHVPVVVERDTGPTVEIASGLSPDDRVVKLPSPELTEGRVVEIAR
jgi:multidrug efflux pump subunit AcrA (membrane-fusion protein)